MSWKRHLDKVGIVGAFVVAACCLGLPAIVSILAAAGLGFLIQDAILLPLLFLFLVATLVGLSFGYRTHRQPGPLALAGISSLAVLLLIFLWTIKVAAYLAIVGLVVATVLNVIAARKAA